MLTPFVAQVQIFFIANKIAKLQLHEYSMAAMLEGT